MLELNQTLDNQTLFSTRDFQILEKITLTQMIETKTYHKMQNRYNFRVNAFFLDFFCSIRVYQEKIILFIVTVTYWILRKIVNARELCKLY